MESRTKHRGVSSVLPACLAVLILGITITRPPTQPGCLGGLSTGSAFFVNGACAIAADTGDRKLEEPFQHTFCMRGCTQEDAPALEIYFTRTAFKGEGDPAPPYIRFEISSLATETIGPITLELSQLRRDLRKPGRIARAELVEAGHQTVWLTGSVTLDEARPGGLIRGRFDVTAADGRRWASSFTADYSSRPTVCG